MPFCPKCKVEYREGFKVCSDCKVELVDSLEEIDDFEEIAVEEVIDNESDNEETKENYDLSDLIDENVLMALDITPEKLEEWKTNPPTPEELLQLKRLIIKQRKLEEEKQKFVSKKEKAADYQSSGIMLLVMGIIGLAFVVLAFCGLIPIVSVTGFGYVIYSVVGLVFALFIYFGISSLSKVKKTKSESIEEESELKEIKKFFDENITKAKIDEGMDYSDDESLNYFMRTEKIKSILKKQYPDLKEGYIDNLIDERYYDIF